MAIEYKKYDVIYRNKKGKEKVYRSNYSLCIDGAEEAARLDCKDLKEIIDVVPVSDIKIV